MLIGKLGNTHSISNMHCSDIMHIGMHIDLLPQFTEYDNSGSTSDADDSGNTSDADDSGSTSDSTSDASDLPEFYLSKEALRVNKIEFIIKELLATNISIYDLARSKVSILSVTE